MCMCPPGLHCSLCEQSWFLNEQSFLCPAKLAILDKQSRCCLLCRVIPNGIHGIEERLHVMWETLVNTGLITPSDFVRLSSTEAAKIFNLYPQKGLIAPGSDADVAIIDPAKEHILSAKTHHSALDTSVYEGMKIKGKVSQWMATN